MKIKSGADPATFQDWDYTSRPRQYGLELADFVQKSYMQNLLRETRHGLREQRIARRGSQTARPGVPPQPAALPAPQP